MDVFPKRYGWIEVISGPMFSGKTEELIRRLVRADYARQGVLLCTKDTRHGEGVVQSHAGRRMTSRYIGDATEILEVNLTGVDVIGIDEGQFFGPHLMAVCKELARRGKRVIVAGLDMDSEESPFENMSSVLAVAEYVQKLSAICVECGAPATRSKRIVESSERYLEGAEDAYKAVCRWCYDTSA